MHPHHASKYESRVEIEICEALQHPAVRAFGEIGLDYSDRLVMWEDLQDASNMELIFSVLLMREEGI